jgi:DNA mismatch repair protein MSH4
MPGSSRSRSATSRESTSYPSGIRKSTTTSHPYTGKSRPRTAATSTGYGENEIICAITESRGISPTIGLSFVNLTTSEAVLCQFADTQTYARTCHKIKVFNPTDILYMSSATDSKLCSILKENLETDEFDIAMTALDRRYWSEATGFEYVQRLAFPTDLESLKVSLSGNYFATCCFASVGPLIFCVPH